MSKINMLLMGRNIPGRTRGLANQVLGTNRAGRNQQMMGRNIPGRGAPGGITSTAVAKDISPLSALALTGVMGGVGGGMVADLTEGFEESAKISNSLLANPEELGRVAARTKMSFDELLQKIKNSGQDIANKGQAYFLQMESGYKDEMQRQQQLKNIQEFGTFEEPEFIPESGEIKPVSLFFAEGDEVKKNNGFPDLSGDGKITRKDILIGQGVEFAEGGEAIDDDLESMQMSEEDAMNQMNQLTQSPEVQMIEQLIAVVQQLIAQGVSEEEIKMFLKEQGLDDEDIESLFEMIAESGMQQEQGANIDEQLQSIM